MTLGDVNGDGKLDIITANQTDSASVLLNSLAFTGQTTTIQNATQATITTLAAGSTSGSAFTTQPVITIQDAFGNTVANSTALVTMTVSAGATTVGTTTINAVNGIATFSGVGISGTAGTPYTLTFASPGLTSATQTITVTPTVTFNDSNIFSDGIATFPNLLITGTGFSTTAASNTVVFSGPASASVVYSITSATSTQLTVTFTTAPTVPGILSAVVTTNGSNSGNAVQVANITTTPAINSTNPPNLAINASTINITGSGISSTANTTSATYNTVTFNLGAVGTVTGVTTDANNYQTLAVSITTPPTSTGILTAIVNTSTTGAAPYLSSGAPVQVANIVAATTVTSTPTNYLATTSPTITINGTGFDTTPGNNSVNFSTGSGTVTAATSTQLTVTFSAPPALGNLTAVVTTNGGNSGSPSGTPVQIATIVGAPTITSNSANLTTTTTTLTINGTNFIPVAANNTVALSLGAVGIVSSATSTQLIVSLITPPSSSGPLTAVVTIYGGNSTPLVQLATSGSAIQVATVVVAPTVNTVNPPSRAINATTLIITGTGFSTTPASNTVAFNLGAFGVVTASTSTQLTVAFTTQPTATGFLTAVVTASGVSSGAPVQVANIVAAPTVTSTTTNLGINATTLTITGTGFNANTPLSNTVTLSSGTGLVTSATTTSLTLTFATQPFLSNLTAVVNSFGGNSGTPSGTPVQVATIVAPPTITTSTASLAINAPTIVINGTGFSNTAASNVVTFNNGAVGTVTTATSTALTVTFSISPLALGTLSASVVSNGITSGNPFGTMVQVATIVAAPTVTFSNANIASVVTTLTILGTGFNATTPASNTVVFSNGAIGTVNSATATQLIVTYSTQPAAGALTAIVTSFGGSSGAAVQVATIIGPTISSVTPSSGTPSGGTPITIVGTNFVSGATVTIGGLAATSVVLVSSTMITAVTPPGTLGTIASVLVTTIDGTSAANSNATYAYSATPVNITITTSQTILRINQTATITFTLSASSTNFILADVVVTGGTLSNFSGSGTLYTATYTPPVATYTTGSIYVPVNAFTDAYGTQSNPSNVVSTIINTIAPPLMASTSISGTGNSQTGIQLVNPFTGALGNV
ncbi:MAG: IPT/TIG domain-containing protein, partial [Enhydrobacter sp.]